MSTSALPERYEVTRRGTPDPENSRYYVIDVVNDLGARVALRALVRTYRSAARHARADELEALLDGTVEDVATRAAVINAERSPKKKSGTGTGGGAKGASKNTNRRSVPMD